MRKCLVVEQAQADGAVGRFYPSGIELEGDTLVLRYPGGEVATLNFDRCVTLAIGERPVPSTEFAPE
jgi:hypothetical protein